MGFEKPFKTLKSESAKNLIAYGRWSQTVWSNTAKAQSPFDLRFERGIKG